MKILFITGTDTGAGKTTVAAALVAALRNRGMCAGAMKPVETGCARGADGALRGDDVELLSVASGERAAHCYLFEAPAAPEIAARAENRAIETETIRAAILREAENKDLLIVEGAGGLLVPLQATYSFADLAADCGAHILLVIGSKLGAVNHASLNFEVLRVRKLPVVGYVVNDLFPLSVPGESIAITTNRGLIASVAARYEMTELCHLPHVVTDKKETTKESEIRALSTSAPIERLSASILEYFRLSR